MREFLLITFMNYWFGFGIAAITMNIDPGSFVPDSYGWLAGSSLVGAGSAFAVALWQALMLRLGKWHTEEQWS